MFSLFAIPGKGRHRESLGLRSVTLPSLGIVKKRLATAILFFIAHPAIAEETKKVMPQLDPSTYASQLFWLAVFFVLFYAFMRGVAMPRVDRILRTREATISGDLDRATTASTEAEGLKAEFEARLNAARDEARSLANATIEQTRARATEQEAALAADIAKRISTAEAAIAAAMAAALGTIDRIAAGIVVEALPKLAPVQVANDEALNAVSRLGQGGK